MDQGGHDAANFKKKLWLDGPSKTGLKVLAPIQFQRSNEGKNFEGPVSPTFFKFCSIVSALVHRIF